MNKFPPKYAKTEILEVKTSRTPVKFDYEATAGSNFAKFAALKSEPINDGEGFIYVRSRAISSRVNKNNDGWPSAELQKAYKTFIGRPVFVDHKNDDVKRARGVIVDATIHVADDKTSALDPYYASSPPEHLPPTHVEILEEIDAKTFPKLAKAILSGKLNATSMGANIQKSICSVCRNEALSPSEYCDHIKAKGQEFEVTGANGETVKKRAYEDCVDINFFEDSFVFDPADETADVLDFKSSSVEKLALGLSMPTDPQAKEELLEILRQLAQANQAQDWNQVRALQAQIEQMVGGQPPQYQAKTAGAIPPEAHYRVADQPGQSCGTCAFFQNGHCSMWDAQVGDDMVCDKWAVTKTSADADNEKHSKTADYPEHSYENAPDHTPKGQKEWPAEVNAVYNACVRERHGEKGEAPDDIQESCAKIAWSQYKKTQKKKESMTAPLLEEISLPDRESGADEFHDEVERMRNEGEIPERPINQLDPTERQHILDVATKAFMNSLHNSGGGDWLSMNSDTAYSNAFIDAKRTVERMGYDSGLAADAASAAKIKFQGMLQGSGGDMDPADMLWPYNDVMDYQDMPEGMKGVRQLNSPRWSKSEIDSMDRSEEMYQYLSARGLIEPEGNKLAALALTADFMDYPMSPATEQGEGRQLNSLPQDDYPHAPEQVDTLRKDVQCPDPPQGCGTATLKQDPDGVLRCPNCGYEQPPPGLDNPDLSPLPDDNLDLSSIQLPNREQPAGKLRPVEPVAPISRQTSVGEISEMNFQTVSKVASVDTTLGEAPINVDTYVALDRAKLSATVTYPNGARTTPPKGNPITDMWVAVKAKNELGLNSIGDVPVRIEAAPDKIDQVLSIIEAAAGRTVKKPLVPSKGQATDEPTDQRIIKDQLQPVTSNVKLGEYHYIRKEGDQYCIWQKGTGKTLSCHASKEKAEEAFRAMMQSKHGKEEDRLKESDQRTIRRTEEEVDGGVRRSEEIVETVGDTETPEETPVDENPEENTETKEDKELTYANVKRAAEEKILAQFELVDLRQELGLIEENQRFAAIGELDDVPLEEIKSRIAELSKVKTAGVVRKTSSTSIPKTPRGLSHTASVSRTNEDDLVSLWRILN